MASEVHFFTLCINTHIVHTGSEAIVSSYLDQTSLVDIKHLLYGSKNTKFMLTGHCLYI